MERRLSYIFIISSIVLSCSKKEPTLFEQVDADHSGIHFNNQIFESDTLNILNEEYIFNGGGVGVGDFNNDGLQDLYFTGNMVSNKLYINQGNLKFKDITHNAGVGGKGDWYSGVAVIDINQDGWLDLYISSTMKKDSLSRRNLLYVNQGLNKDGIPDFKEMAKEYGIDDAGNTTHSAFFDYDNDGDLDLYVLTNVINEKVPGLFRDKIIDGSAVNNDQLYRNNGNGTFTNVTKEAGILIEGYGLGVCISDINLDGWQDIYVTNDYMSNDLLYINNGNGTFTNRVEDYIKHTCFSAMGTDVVDMNNDGLVEIIALDMLPEDNKRRKMMVKDNNYISYINNEKYGYQHQYIRNVLQLNQGFSPKGHPIFSEVGQLSGVFQTDWSWTPLVADFDNDGLRDIIITNGFPRDITDRDFATYRAGVGNLLSTVGLLDSIPVVKIPNYAFKNMGNILFEDKTSEWGLHIPSFSNGAIYSDLDNDGDLDVVVNNINDKAFLFKNTLNDSKGRNGNNFLRISFKGKDKNASAFGTKVEVYAEGAKQFYEHSPFRGYLSTVESVGHFGLGEAKIVDSLKIYWYDGSFQLLKNLPINYVFHADIGKAENSSAISATNLSSSSIFNEVSKDLNIQYKHAEQDKIDFNIQRTLPHKYTQDGPGISVGDIDGNGFDDIYLAGSARKKGIFFKQQSNGVFIQDSGRISSEPLKLEEELSCIFFDADGDDDLDLYVVTGSYEFEPDSPFLKDKLYKNDGKGFFAFDSLALPDIRSAGSCVRAADFDNDGDLDLFIGGKVVPGKYPQPAKSSILINNNGTFTDITSKVCPELDSLGLVSDALWTDFDNDNQLDLIIAGEWMPLTFFKNSSGSFKNVTKQTGIADQIGWWGSLTSGDFDNDGDIDYIAGNLGLNTHYVASKERPLTVYAKDFDNSGLYKALLFCYIKNEEGELKSFPMHTRDDLFVMMTNMKKKFPRYKTYAAASINEILTPEEREGALTLSATHFASSYIENLGNGKFKMADLPLAAQLSPLKGMLTDDYDGDGNIDVLIVGNDYGAEVFTGRYDAMVGLLLKGNGKGGFLPVTLSESGFLVDGDAKGLAQLYSSTGNKIIVATQNRDSLRVFKTSSDPVNKPKVVSLSKNEYWGEVKYKDGKKARKEFYFGNTYLSQSSRKITLSPNVESLTIFDNLGKSRVIKP